MENIKNYVIVLELEKAAQEKVGNFRLERIGQELVDNLPAHITFKMRFAPKKNVSESDIIDLMNDFDLPRQIISFDRVEKFGDALVLIPEKSELGKYHKDFCKLAESKLDSLNVEFEGSNFNPHITLYRDNETEGCDVYFMLEDVSVERMNLYEIDSMSKRNFANLIYSRELSID